MGPGGGAEGGGGGDGAGDLGCRGHGHIVQRSSSRYFEVPLRERGAVRTGGASGLAPRALHLRRLGWVHAARRRAARGSVTTAGELENHWSVFVRFRRDRPILPTEIWLVGAC